YMDAVIEWHRKGLLPLGTTLVQDGRCRLTQADFFARSRETAVGFDPEVPDRKFDAILLDIDHTPTHVLNQTNTRFYTREGLTELASHLKPGGVFGLWSDDEPDAEFTTHLKTVFPHVQAHLVEFYNPFTGEDCGNTVYVARLQ
ncbi:MAG: spermidine synthase, partial [Desulfobacterales bacterium]|nr:spermidine synthase [Desulfobacterales bacterium]